MSHDTLMLGVDAGGTSTRGVLVTEQGGCLGYGLGGRGNPTSAGLDRAAEGVRAAIAGALAATGRTLAEVSVIVFAIAGQSGVDDRDTAWLRDPLAAEGFRGRVVLESDLLATYFSGTAESFGYAVVAGTGASVIRVSDGRIDAVADGLGWLVGDRGSGFWIGQRVAKAVVRDLDGAGPATTLTPGLLEMLGIEVDDVRREGRGGALVQLVKSLYALAPIELADFAPLAVAAGDPVAGGAGDPVAAGILRRAGSRLADSLVAVLAGPGPLVIGGGVLGREGLVRDAFLERLGDRAAGLPLLPVVDGAVGAGLLALRAGGVTVSARTLELVAATMARFR
ncbi:N-acetylglucosamine kinase [Microbacterium sp. A204]|uniref:N-acetylglucosamine kinase n=1 Tax=Microbacterium sp. A204 TaxID=3457321 RepID=UPI003FCF392E